MKKTLQSVRVKQETLSRMESAIKKFNLDKKNIVNLNLQSFRRLAYETLSHLILTDKEIPVKLEN